MAEIKNFPADFTEVSAIKSTDKLFVNSNNFITGQNLNGQITSNLVGKATTTTNPPTPTSVVRYDIDSSASAQTFTNFKDSTGTAITVPAKTNGYFLWNTAGYWDFITLAISADVLQKQDIGSTVASQNLLSAVLNQSTSYDGTDVTSSATQVASTQIASDGTVNSGTSYSNWLLYKVATKKGEQLTFTGRTGGSGTSTTNPFAAILQASGGTFVSVLANSTVSSATTTTLTAIATQDGEFWVNTRTDTGGTVSLSKSTPIPNTFVAKKDVGVSVQPFDASIGKLIANTTGDISTPYTITWVSGLYGVDTVGAQGDTITANTGWHCVLIPLMGYNQFTISAFTITGSFSMVKYLDANKLNVGATSWGTAESGLSHTITVPSGAAYLALSTPSAQSPTVTRTVTGSKLYATPTDLSALGVPALNTSVNKLNYNTDGTVSAPSSAWTTGFYGYTNNILTTSSASDWRRLPVLDINGVAKFKITIPTIAGNYQSINFVDDSLNIISGISIATTSAGVQLEYTKPSGATKVAICYKPTTTSDAYPTVILFSSVTEIYVTPKTALKNASYWNGKTIWWCGTSIPAQGYPQLVGANVGATVYNESVGSSMARAGISDYSTDPLNDKYLGIYDVNWDSWIYSIATPQETKAEVMQCWTVAQRKAYLIANKGYTSDQVSGLTKGLGDLLLGSFYGGNTDPSLGTTFPSAKPNDINADQWDAFRKRVLSLSYNSATNAYPNCGTIQGKIDKYFENGINIDFWVFDHGHKDGRGNETAATFASIPTNPTDNCYFLGALNLLIKRILSFNPKAKFLFMSHYTDKAGAGSEPVRIKAAHQAIAAYWQAPLCDLYNRVRVGQAIVTTNGYWSSQTQWNNTGFNGTNDTSTHQESSNAKNPRQLANGTWVRDLTEKQTWFWDDLHPADTTAKQYIADAITGFINTVR